MLYRENALTPEEYMDLRASVGWRGPFGPGQAEKALENSHTTAAYENGLAIAMGRITGDGLYWLITDVVVRPEYQGRGFGRRIIDRLTLYAESCTPPGGRCSVYLISDNGKEEFYEKQGFKSLPNHAAGHGMRKVIHKA